MYAQLKCNTYFFTPLSIMNSSKLSEPTLFKISSLLNSIFTFFGVVLEPFIGRVARYTPSSRLKNALKIKANLEFHKSLDYFIVMPSVQSIMIDNLLLISVIPCCYMMNGIFYSTF